MSEGACQSTPVPITSSPALSSVNWTRRVVQGNSRKMSKAENTNFPPLCLLPAVPGHSGPQTSPAHSADIHTHTHTHTHTHDLPVQGSLQPVRALPELCPWFSFSSSLPWANGGEERKKPALIHHLDRTLKLLIFPLT